MKTLKDNMTEKSRSHKKSNIFYTLLILIVVATVGVLSSISTSLSSGEVGVDVATNTVAPISFWEKVQQTFGTFAESVLHSISSHFGLLLLQIIVILIAARCLGWLFAKLGQPSVIGEVIAGILLGPSVLGMLFPGVFVSLFPQESLHNISLLSQFGLIFFMFVVGMELDLNEIRERLHSTFVISHAGIIIPFVLGAVTSYFLYEEYAGEAHSFLPFALFIGISMSITAFPVLARILQERGEMSSHVGIVSLASAANGDITGWCLVAMVMALSQVGSATSALFTVLFAALYMVTMFFVIRPLFRLVGKVFTNLEMMDKGVIALVFLTLLASAYVTKILGLHPLFGAFMAGVVMPDDFKFRRLMTEKVEDVSLSIFLPLFFVASGLNTEIGLLNTTMHWLLTLLLIAIAILGKLGGSYAAARVVGETRRDSLYIGLLMNTRGLNELVILSMGYSLGILSPTIFAMLVIMTLTTTVITTPLIKLADKLLAIRGRRRGEEMAARFSILFSFGRTSTGLAILNLIETFFARKKDAVEITGMHLTVSSDVSLRQAEHFRTQNFAPIEQDSTARGLQTTERYEVTDNAEQAILHATHDSHIDLLLVGSGIDLSNLPQDLKIRNMRRELRSRFGAVFTGASRFFSLAQTMRDKSEIFVRGADASVGVVLDRGLKDNASNILVVHHSEHSTTDGYVPLVQSLLQYSTAKSVCMQLSTSQEEGEPLVGETYGVETLLATRLTPELLQDYDLMLIPYEAWKEVVVQNPDILSVVPTTILLAPKQSIER